MYKLKFYLLVLFNSIIISSLFSQFSNQSYTINWQSKQAFFSPESKEGGQEKHLLYFESAIYDYSKNYLPIFSELIKINTENIKVELTNARFSILTNEEVIEVIDIDKIPDNIEVKNTLQYNRKQPYLEFSFIPLRKNRLTGQYEKLISFEVKRISSSTQPKFKKIKRTFANKSVLSSGKWIKIKIAKSGIYKLTFDELRNLGIDQPENVRIFGNGGKMLPYYNSEERADDLIENHVLIQNNEVYFYGDGPVQWQYYSNENFFTHQLNIYSDFAYYFLSSEYNSGQNNNIVHESSISNDATHTITSFVDLIYHEIDTLNLIGSGKLWVGEHFDFQTDYRFDFAVSNLVSGSIIKLNTSLLARSPISSFFTIKMAGQTFPNSIFLAVNYDYTATYATQKKELFETLVNNLNEINIQIQYNKSTASSEAWLDYLSINAQRELKFENEQLHFRNPESTGLGNISQFQLSSANDDIIVWDISNPQRPRQVDASLNGSSLNFRLETDTLREFIAFEPSMAYTPILDNGSLGVIENQNLHAINQADMIIISHPEFMDYANELKQIHENELNIHLVNIEQVYNEFSSGAPDVSAIRDFMKMLYDRATTTEQLPKYLCLFGDGSYDNKHSFSENTNFIPTYQSENSVSPTHSFVTDDFFGLLDDNEGGHEGLMDIGIGRIPVKTKTEAANSIQKIRNYLSIDAYNDWKNRLCFIADDEDNNIHQKQADELSLIIKNNYPVFNIEKVYLDAFVQESSSAGQRYPDANLSINNQIDKGILVMNYTGHGNENGLAEERIISVDQISKWSNQDKLPIFMTATCEFSRFDNYEKTTAGEQVFLNPNGGAVAMFTTTRLVYASPNFELNKNFYNFLFENDITTNKRYRFGDIMRLTKNASGSGINKRNFTLLGDPALELSFAKFRVKTNLINSTSAQGQADTLKAFDKVNITGEVQDENGIKITDYNGILYPTVFDKEQEIKTLNNDGEGVFNYKTRNNQLFKGKASVKNGDFQFSFIVPKDIRYNVDTGKISYYSTNHQLFKDAKGSFKNVLIGSSGTNDLSDKDGPKIKIYLNDESFVSGGITNSTPKLLAFLNDESGINTTGNGIGHDIIVTIDDDADQKFTLNDYYESDIDDFTSGQLNYLFPELEPGEHKLHLKAWDVYNNSAEDSIIFNVVESEKLKISHVLNYPNPFSTNTSFFFEHNRPNESLEILIHIFSVTGKIVKTIHTEIVTTGFRSQGIQWDGKDDFGNKIGRGVYFYKLAVRTPAGEKTDKIEKLLILN